MPAERIEDYALLGDLQTAALVDRGGSVDWLCFPRFDSGACFAALLGDENHGRWLVRPAGDARSERRYLHDTLVLETIWETADGRARVLDFMPPRGDNPDIVRIVEGVSGRVAMRSELVIRFDYGSILPWVRRIDDARVAVGGPDALCFRTSAPTRGENMRTISEFWIDEGERVPFVLTWYPSHSPPPRAVDPEHALRDTEEFWREWVNRCAYDGPQRELVQRSLLVLKALTYEPTGGIVAAATTSLPEAIGGVRNWDYRYCWVRDATLTLLALLHGGYSDEAASWRRWVLRAAAGDPAALQIMYGVAGERRLTEITLDWLPGFAESAPVRVGNAASEQLQIDVYGELIDALYQAREHGLPREKPAWALQRKLLAYLEHAWQQPDEGMWEIRGERQHFTHSKVMAWVAFDRAVRTVENQGLPGPVDHWRKMRDRIHADVCERGYNADKGTFVQHYDTTELDANLLMIPLVGFLPANDERVCRTVEAVQRELGVDGLVARYRNEADGVDGLPGSEGVFLACSFWLVDCLELLGRHDEAHELFDRLCRLANDLGLFAEEYDPKQERQLGNFPQALTHLALVNSAFNLTDAHPPMRKRHAEPEY